MFACNPEMARLKRSFFTRSGVCVISRELLGMHLFTRSVKGQVTGGIIVETEAYGGADDRASHAYNNRRTGRTEVMFHKGGVAYVYLCYGMHYLFNVVTAEEGVPHAVLVRAVEPTHGIKAMLKRRGHERAGRNLSAGPGRLTSALGINSTHNGLSLLGSRVWIEDRKGRSAPDFRVDSGPRVGVDYAGSDAGRPWRFRLRGSGWVSRP